MSERQWTIRVCENGCRSIGNPCFKCGGKIKEVRVVPESVASRYRSALEEIAEETGTPYSRIAMEALSGELR